MRLELVVRSPVNKQSKDNMRNQSRAECHVSSGASWIDREILDFLRPANHDDYVREKHLGSVYANDAIEKTTLAVICHKRICYTKIMAEFLLQK